MDKEIKLSLWFVAAIIGAIVIAEVLVSIAVAFDSSIQDALVWMAGFIGCDVALVILAIWLGTRSSRKQ